MADRLEIRVRPSSSELEAAEAPADEPSRSRVGRALLCPFCRDEIDRRDVVACSNRSCRALYHRACWTECADHYGGCAIWGCGSRQAREISSLGYAVFLLRLFVAALFLPPRAAQRVREAGGESLPATAITAFRACRRALPDRWTVGLAAGMFVLTASVFAALGAAEVSRRGTLGADFAWSVAGALLGSGLGGSSRS